MNVNEFFKYVDKFEGNYSDEILFEICDKAKKETDLTWKELNDYLNINKSTNALKKWYYRAKDKNQNNIKIVKDQSTDIPQYDNEQEFVDQYKIITQNRDIMNSYRKMIRETSRIEALRDYIKECVNELPKLPNFPYSIKVRTTGTEAVALLSDLHMGVNCDNFYNKYNLEVAIERLNRWTDNVLHYCDIMNVKKLHILNLGDMIHGLIHTSARVEQQFDVVSQIINAAELIAKALNKLSQAPIEILYRSCTDNHSRAVADLHSHIEQENFHRLIDWYLEERLAGTSIKFVNDNLDKSMGLFELENGKLLGFAHGHHDSINVSFQNFVGATKKFVDYICLGHYHCEKVKSFQGSTIIVNGSIVGTEQYANSKRLYSDPSQLLLIFDGNNRLNISINLK